MRKSLLAASLLAAISTAHARPTVRADAPSVEWSRESCPVRCVVTHNHGGSVYEFTRAADQIKHDRRHLVIDGPCVSACTIAADKVRPFICITANASFEFHRGFDIDSKGREIRVDVDEEYSPDILGWVHRHGGFPGKNVNDSTLLVMNSHEAARYFRFCGRED